MRAIGIGAVVLAAALVMPVWAGGQKAGDDEGDRGSAGAAEQALLTRVEQYWEALASHDVVTAYNLESEARPRGDLDPRALMPNPKIRIEGFELGEPTIEGKEAVVPVSYKERLLDFAQGRYVQTVKTQSRWVRIDGDWFHKTAASGSQDPAESLMKALQEGRKGSAEGQAGGDGGDGKAAGGADER